jgi:hypothetical protein
VLFVRDNHRAEIYWLGPGATEERELSWGDWSVLADVSADKRTLLFSEQGDAVGGNYAVCIRGTDGSPVVKLGNGNAMDLSPDGRYALASTLDTPTDLVVLPTGTGEAKTLPRGAIRNHFHAAWLPDGRQIMAIGEDSTGNVNGYIQDVVGGDPRRVIANVDFTGRGIRVTPDGRYAVPTPFRKLYSLTGGPPIDIPGIQPYERFFCAGIGQGGREIFVAALDTKHPPILGIDVKTGARRVIRVLSPRDPAGVLNLGVVRVTSDGKAIAYSLDRNLSEVYVAKGLR